MPSNSCLKSLKTVKRCIRRSLLTFSDTPWARPSCLKSPLILTSNPSLNVIFIFEQNIVLQNFHVIKNECNIVVNIGVVLSSPMSDVPHMAKVMLPNLPVPMWYLFNFKKSFCFSIFNMVQCSFFLY